MSEKRPETDADIVSRSRMISDAELARAPGVQGKGKRRRKGYSVDLPSHMAQCDANYHRLQRLFPSMQETQLPSAQIALPLTDFDAQVVFEVLEQGPYTTLVQVDVLSDDKWVALAAAPSFTVRVYHDARSAEVVSYQKQNRFHGKYEYPNNRMRQRDEKVQINRFLGEFLELCMQHGASAHPVTLKP